MAFFLRLITGGDPNHLQVTSPGMILQVTTLNPPASHCELHVVPGPQGCSIPVVSSCNPVDRGPVLGGVSIGDSWCFFLQGGVRCFLGKLRSSSPQFRQIAMIS